MATPTDHSTMEASVHVSDFHMATSGVVSDIFKVTRRAFGGAVENAKVNVAKLYLRQIDGANQSVVIPGNNQTGLGTTGVSNWAIYDRPGLRGKLVANGQGMFTHAGSWNQWFTIVFKDNVQERFEGSSLQVMGANDNDDEEESEWAIVGGTGEFAMARGIIKRRQFSDNHGIIKQELYDIEFFCRMKVPAPAMTGPWGANGGSLREMEGKSQRLESVTINYLGTVHLIKFSYIDEDGQIHTSGTWGTVYEHPSTKNEIIRFGPSEVVKKISLTGGLNGSRQYVANLEIVTNHQTYGPFGDWSGGSKFNYTVPEDETVVGFFAKTETYVNSIGVYTI